MTTDKRDKLIDQLRIELGKVFELDSDIPEVKHFWVKLFGGCALLAVEMHMVTLLIVFLMELCLQRHYHNTNFMWLLGVSAIMTKVVNIVFVKLFSYIKRSRQNEDNIHHS